MPSAYATKVAEGFASKLFKIFYANTPIDEFVNRDYEGDINRVGSKLNILTLQKVLEQDYDGSNLSADDLTEVNTVLEIDQQKAFYWKERTIDKWKSYIKEPKGTVLEQTANERKANVMKYILGFSGDAAAGQWYGTDYTTGTVTVTVTTGAVTGSGTTFTSSMVGKPFMAAGHSKWYRVKTYSSATSIVIENDSDDETSAYDGGAIGAGASYTIQANTAKAVDNGGSNPTFLTMVLKLAEYLDEAQVPQEDRVLFVPAKARTTIMKDAGIKISVPQAWEPMIQKGLLTELEGFKVVVLPSAYFQGDSSNGYHVIAAHRSFLTFADKVLEVGMEEDLIGNFGSAYKDLYVYGAKVSDERRKSAAHAFVTFG
jgi:hypothetical protein